MQEVNNILRILEGTKKAIKHGDTSEMKSLSNQTINTASMTQDPDNIAVAVIVYSLSKILERRDYQSLKGWNTFHRIFVSAVERAIQDIKEGSEVKFRKEFEMINQSIERLSGKLKNYVEEVLRSAKINKASRIHEHGISLEQTARLLGVSQYELADYIGRTGISEVPESRTMDSKSRIKLAMELFT